AHGLGPRRCREGKDLRGVGDPEGQGAASCRPLPRRQADDRASPRRAAEGRRRCRDRGARRRLARSDDNAHSHLGYDLGQAVRLNRMVQSKTTVDRAFAALADPTRRAVLERLGSGSATISELAEPFGMSLTGMKKHVRLLEEAELVTTEKVGRVRRCTLVPYAFEGISTWLLRLDRFAQVVERTKGAP